MSEEKVPTLEELRKLARKIGQEEVEGRLGLTRSEGDRPPVVETQRPGVVLADAPPEYLPENEPNQEEGEGNFPGRTVIGKVNYSHDTIIDLILADPMINQTQIAKITGYTNSWLSIMINSPAFQMRLAERKGELIDPQIMASFEDKLRNLATMSAEVLETEMARAPTFERAIKVLGVTAKSLGYGAAQRNQVPVQNNFVVNLPGPAQSSQEWAEKFAGQGSGEKV